VTLLITTLGFLDCLPDGAGCRVRRLEHDVQRGLGADAEIATLRALGFGGGAVIISLMIESLLLALLGAQLAGTYLSFSQQLSYLDDEFSKLQPGHVCLQGDAGIAGAGNHLGNGDWICRRTASAIRAVRMPIASALREL